MDVGANQAATSIFYSRIGFGKQRFSRFPLCKAIFELLRLPAELLYRQFLKLLFPAIYLWDEMRIALQAAGLGGTEDLLQKGKHQSDFNTKAYF